ncbi:hypothetical protein [Stenotrophomonas sp. GD03958]|uniref:phosphoribosyltransferase-like protein n=1 Tax=Stenotrophomonas sp. GD03958 TaxID=2975411 RepID=UPI00244A951F|nr:hypothetical protein [Stenotrophomonas sp. GD03958]MDH1192728.1 hypothetical protein [Stenotrophomonas sp. GD03958]
MEWILEEPELSLRKAEFFSLINLWPNTADLDVSGWLSNFNEDERILAGHLLSGFVYLNRSVVTALFISAFHQLSTSPYLTGPTDSRRENWEWFRQNVVVTHVEGETPSTTDSGHIFARLARTALGIPEANIVAPERALRILSSGSGRPIVFVDDFLGSGNQFSATWERFYSISSAHESNFKREVSHHSTSIYFIPLIATKSGVDCVAEVAPQVSICAAHVLDGRDSALTPDSQVWPEDLREQGVEMIHAASSRAGIQGDDWQGFGKLGLCLSFEHSTPDATLPIFYHEENWHPLIKRT